MFIDFDCFNAPCKITPWEANDRDDNATKKPKWRKLKDDQVKHIRENHGIIPAKILAEMHGVSRYLIYGIQQRKIYRDVD